MERDAKQVIVKVQDVEQVIAMDYIVNQVEQLIQHVMELEKQKINVFLLQNMAMHLVYQYQLATRY